MNEFKQAAFVRIQAGDCMDGLEEITGRHEIFRSPRPFGNSLRRRGSGSGSVAPDYLGISREKPTRSLDEREKVLSGTQGSQSVDARTCEPVSRSCARILISGNPKTQIYI